MPSDTIDKHRKYLASVPREIIRRRLEAYRLREDVMDVPSFVCKSLKIAAPFEEYLQWIHPLDPVSLDDLKNWFGVPNETAKRMLTETRTLSEGGKLWAGISRVIPRALPMQREYDFRSLDPEQKLAVRTTANYLLYGYVDPEKAKVPPFAGVIRFMLASAAAVPLAVLTAPDLIVCDDDIYEFNNLSVLFFNNVLIYGNGQIITRGKTTIDAYQIRHE